LPQSRGECDKSRGAVSVLYQEVFMLLARAALERALDELTAAHGFGEIARDLEFDGAAFARCLRGASERLGLGELLSRVDAEPHHSWAARALVAVLAFRRAAGSPEQRGQIDAPLQVGSLELLTGVQRSFPGSLTVDGNLKVSGRLTVAGDLTVRGHYQDRLGAQVVVGGKLACAGYLRTEGFLAVGGALTAALVYLDFNQGVTKVLDGARAKLLIESEHAGSRIFGRVDADYLSYDELRCDAAPAQDAERLARLLVSDLAQPATSLEGGDLASLLIGLLDEGQPVFRA
jgi:hypothetical protein